MEEDTSYINKELPEAKGHSSKQELRKLEADTYNLDRLQERPTHAHKEVLAAFF